jgi:hypothetical protein
MPILGKLGLPIQVDQETGDVFTSRREFGEFLRSIAQGAE